MRVATESDIAAQRAGEVNPGPYQVNVIVSNIRCAVESIGGWMFDRATAGWHVKVFLPQGSDTRPMRILGVRSVDGYDQASVTASSHRRLALAIDMAVLEADEDVMLSVANAANVGCTEITMFGDVALPDLTDRADRVQHRLSAAAAAFKAQALRATKAKSSQHIAHTEEFLRYPMGRAQYT
jgi:hypothetical protein